MRCLYLSERKRIYGPIVSGLIPAAARSNIGVRFYGDDLSDCSEILVFTNRAETFPELKTDAKIGWWMCDYRRVEEMGPLRQRVDKIFLCNTQLADDYEKAYGTEVYYIPQCGWVEPYWEGRNIDWDVLFMGNLANQKYHDNRAGVINEIKKNWKVQIISGQKRTPDSHWLYQQTPFSLAVSLPLRGYTSNRLYNILAAKGFCLTLHFPGIEELFENHKHLVWFHQAEEIHDIINHYFNNPKEHERVREAGHGLFLKEHTAQHRLDMMFSILHEGNNKEDAQKRKGAVGSRTVTREVSIKESPHGQEIRNSVGADASQRKCKV